MRLCPVLVVFLGEEQLTASTTQEEHRDEGHALQIHFAFQVSLRNGTGLERRSKQKKEAKAEMYCDVMLPLIWYPDFVDMRRAQKRRIYFLPKQK